MLSGFLMFVQSGSTLFNETRLDIYLTCTQYYNISLGVFNIVGSTANVTFWNGTINMKFYSSAYYKYVSLFSNYTYSSANVSVYNYLVNLSNGTGVANIYASSYVYLGGVYYLSALASYYVTNTTFYQLLFFQNYSYYSGIICG